MSEKLKTRKTIRPYYLFFRGYDIIIPTGSTVSNYTACGIDDNYRFWTDFDAIAEKMTGFSDSTLKYELKHYRINIPAEYCEPY